jgi:hypothetical protein
MRKSGLWRRLNNWWRSAGCEEMSDQAGAGQESKTTTKWWKYPARQLVARACERSPLTSLRAGFRFAQDDKHDRV